ncbi:MAG: 50S ribosomal protein L9 [Patescibacteria group bacterium]
MKIVLIKDVKGVGKKHDIRTVADGFASNSLIPHGMAEVATGEVLGRVEKAKKREETDKKVREDLLSKNIKSLHDVVVEVALPANEKGHLFAGLHTAEIAPLVREQTRIDVLPEFIKLDKPIKETGEYKIDVFIHGQSATFILNIKAK